VLERQREALAAAAVLGIRQVDFLGARDQELRASAETVASLRNVLRRRVPDLVYVPFFLDNHVDHFETNRVFIHAVREYTGALMVAAFVVSCLFLASYVTRFALSGDTKFGGEGAIRYVYFALLISHVLLAVAVPPLAIRTLYLAVKKRFDAHRRIARITFPIWLYVSVTGVLVYLMLYQWFPRVP
jgi:putative membrane protein